MGREKRKDVEGARNLESRVVWGCVGGRQDERLGNCGVEGEV